MATPIFRDRASVSQYYHLLLHFHSPKVFGTSCSIDPRRRSWRREGTLVCCTPTPSNPIGPASPAVVGPELSFCFGELTLFHTPRRLRRVEKMPSFSEAIMGVLLLLLMASLVLHEEESAVCYQNLETVFYTTYQIFGWAEKNVNPALFSRELMTRASSLLEDEEVSYDPRNLIKKAHAATSSVGSATVIVAMLEKNGSLKIANVGDCGLRVIRKGQIVFSTSPQEHHFDCPYQLSSEAVGQTYLDATVCSVELVKGDTLVMGSDGLFDNVFDGEIISTVSTCINVSNTAKALANLAHTHSLDLRYDSPYYLEARARGFDVPWWKKMLGIKLTGGKLDDITVVVGQVESS